MKRMDLSFFRFYSQRTACKRAAALIVGFVNLSFSLYSLGNWFKRALTAESYFDEKCTADGIMQVYSLLSWGLEKIHKTGCFFSQWEKVLNMLSLLLLASTMRN